MISFPCEKCGKRFDRPDATAGSLVWCACGARNVVPWESALPPAPEPPPPPPLGPQWSGWDRPAPTRRERRSGYCFNHQETAAQPTCADCGESFCPDCLVTLHGRALCGPCKNFAARRAQKPPRVCVLAVLSPVVSMVLGPFAVLLLAPMAIGVLVRGPGGDLAGAFTVIAALGMAVQAVAFIMGVIALRRVEGSEGLAGRSWAVTGLVGSGVGLLLIGEIAWLVVRMI